jgi:hypothetical protein
MNDTEYRIECKVERLTDSIDRRYMNGELSDSQYHEGIRAIDAWAEAQYKMIGETA